MQSILNRTIVVACILTSGSHVRSVTGQSTEVSRKHTISVDSARPLAAAIRQLEADLGQIITYEDPPYLSPSTYKDITATASRNPHPKMRTLVPRGGRFDFSYDVRETLPPGADRTRSVLTTLVQTYNRVYPGVGSFDVVETAGAYHVVPTLAPRRDGTVGPYDSLLETLVSPPETETNALSALQAVVSQATTTSGRTFVLGTVPINGLYHTKVNFPGGQKSAREVVWETLQGTGQRLSWQILCEPGTEPSYCVLNIYGFPR